MWQRIEITGLLIGLAGAAAALIEIYFWSSFSEEVRALFYGGEPGALVIGTCLIIGLLSSLLFLVNLICKRFALWWLRLVGFISLYIGFAAVGASGI